MPSAGAGLPAFEAGCQGRACGLATPPIAECVASNPPTISPRRRAGVPDRGSPWLKAGAAAWAPGRANKPHKTNTARRRRRNDARGRMGTGMGRAGGVGALRGWRVQKRGRAGRNETHGRATGAGFEAVAARSPWRVATRTL